MNRHRDRDRSHRDRRRDFDQDFEPIPFARPIDQRQAPAATGSPVEATVKWFNALKGFGFVGLADGSPDVFLHATAVKAVGHNELPEGTRLTVRISQGAKGPQVAEVLSVALPDGSANGRTPPGSDHRPGQEVPGTVKWFNSSKGFGFIALDDGGKDVFVHVSALARAGVSELQEGQRVTIQIEDGKKGPQASTLRLADWG